MVIGWRLWVLERIARAAAKSRSRLYRHHDLAEMLVGFHVLERLVDRQLQFPRFPRRPDVLRHLLKNLADFFHCADAEGDPIEWMRRAALRSKLKSAWKPRSPTRLPDNGPSLIPSVRLNPIRGR